MIHRVIYGSVERFFGILVEHFAGRFPLWMAPVQASVLAMNDAIVPYAAKVRERLAQNGLRVEFDDRAESINKKVRDAQLKAVPLMLTIGEKERENNTLALRTLDGKVRYNVSLDSFLEKVLAHIAKRGIEPDPFGGE
jgi:threonyl-tRNA synthetase